MRWTASRLETGRQLFGILWDPKYATKEEEEAVMESEREEFADEENLYNPDRCKSCQQWHAGSHCPSRK